MKQAICLILIINFFKLSAQTTDQTLILADELYAKKSYENAIEAYKRVQFFDSVSKYSLPISVKIADCLFKSGQYEEAGRYFDHSYFLTENDSIKNECLLNKISCFLILKQYEYANIELQNINTQSLVLSQIGKYQFQNGVLNYAMEDFDTSEKYFKAVCHEDTTKITQIFNGLAKADKINPRKARILSMIVPGLGQFYLGDIKNGLNSLLLNAGLIYLGIHLSQINGIFDATLAVLPWFQRYYQGGFTKAETIAYTKIQKIKYSVYNQLLDETKKYPINGVN